LKSKGTRVPYFVGCLKKMIEKHHIQGIIEQFIKGTGMFLVSVKVSSANRITVLADRNEGITIDDCASIHRHIESSLDREKEDFELLVSSPGLDTPFIVIEQYYKNEGRIVEVIDNDGTKSSGKLKNVTTGGFEIESEVKVKGKTKEIKDFSFNFEQIKSTRVVLTIK
jgi:ribosome maturation factor RimP